MLLRLFCHWNFFNRLHFTMSKLSGSANIKEVQYQISGGETHQSASTNSNWMPSGLQQRSSNEKMSSDLFFSQHDTISELHDLTGD